MKIGIAGAGILGRLLAFELLNAGHHVAVFDKDSSKNCSAAAAGLLTPATELEKNPLVIYQLGMDALNIHWPAVLAKLSQPVYFQRQGSLVLAHPQDRVELSRYIEAIAAKSIHKTSYKHINKTEILELESELTKFNDGCYFSDEGQIDNQQLLEILKFDLNKKNISWYENMLVSHVSNNQIIANHTRYQFDMVFDCRGMGSKDTFTDLRSIRGELIWLHAPDVNISRLIRFIHPRYSLYIVPRPGNVYLIGASEIESDDTGEISVRTSLELLTAAYYIHPGFCDAKIIKTVTQCRPTLSDHLPKIKYQKNFAAINGLYRHGYLIAPTLVTEVMRWIEDGFSALKYPQLWEKIHD